MTTRLVKYPDRQLAAHAAAGGVGFVPVENLVGRGSMVLGSWDLTALQRPFWTWASGFRLSRFFSGVS